MPEKQPPNPDEKPRISADQPQGAFVRTLYVERTVTIYPIDESKLETISIFNGLTTAFSAVGTGSLMFAFGIAVDIAITGESTEQGKTFAVAIYWACAVITAIAYVVAAIAFFRRRSILGVIRRESRPASQLK